MRHSLPGGRSRLLALSAVAGAAVAASPAAASSDATRFASEATAYQNATIASALGNNPSGVRTGPATVQWRGGAVVMTVPVTVTASVAQPSAVAASPARAHAVFARMRVASRRHGARAHIAATGTFGCPKNGFLQTGNDWTCVYNQLQGAGTRLQFQDAGYYQDLHHYGGNNWISESYSNTRGQRSWLNENDDHNNSGASYCMSGHTASGNMTASRAIYDRWIYLSTNSDPC
jgi:hypothetical protein